MLKTLMLSLLIGAGMIWNTTVIAAPLDEITMEVIEMNDTETSDVLNEIQLPARFEREGGMNMDESREEMKSSRDNMRDSRDEVRESKERLNESKDQVKGN
jgi:hypothetical protein